MTNLKQMLSTTKNVIFEYHIQALYVFVITSIGGYITAENLWPVILELAQSPTPLWATITLGVMVYLLLKITISRTSFTPKPKEPDLSKKTELQEQILKSLESESMSSWIAQNLKFNEQEIIKNLESLEDSGLVMRSKYNYPISWHLSKSGRAYLYPST